MITRQLLAILFLTLCITSCRDSRESTFRMPGEFERHDAVWLGWETDDSTIYPVVHGIIKALSGKVAIKIAVDNDSLRARAKAIVAMGGIDTAAIQFLVTPGDRYWIRDHGAAFLTDESGKLAVADFGWKLYGYYDWRKLREPERADTIAMWEQQEMNGPTSRVDSMMAIHTGATIIKSKLVIEGGALESNGKGVLIQNEQVTLQRNPGWTKAQIEEEYKRVLGVKKVLWMKKGLADDEHIYHLHNRKYVTMGTGGHTDEFVRFADARTILLAWVDEADLDVHPLNRVTHERMVENLKILEAATDQDGQPFRIIKVPLPSLVEWPAVVAERRSSNEFWKLTPQVFLASERPSVGDTLIRVAATSYLNFLVSNGTMLNATYIAHGTPAEREARVKAIFKEVFPDREQHWLDALPVNRSGGGIHCSTQQQPAVK